MNRLARTILDALAAERPPRAMHANELAMRLGVHDKRALSHALEELVDDGVVRKRAGKRYALAAGAVASAPPEVEGVLHVNAKGYGFLRVAGATDDVFIPFEAMAGAMHGDRVKAKVAIASRRGLEGSVVEVLARGRRRVVGVLRGRGRSLRLEPDDQRIRGPIPLERGEDDDLDDEELRDGSAAVVELVRYPRFPDELPLGRVLAALGTPGDPDVEVSKILIEHAIDEEQPEESVAEARAFGDAIDPVEAARREDLRDLKLVTIDPRTARDHDDAVWVERRDDGGFRAVVAIADVSSYVRPGTALDASALARGNSVYLPDRAIPMLPHELSSGLCSLLPQVDRLCMAVEIECDASGAPRETRVFEGVMRSHAFLTYDSVARALGWSSEAERDPEADAMRSDLQVMWELSSLLRTRRMRRGALDLELPESDIQLDDATRAPTDVTERAVDPGVRKAYRLIEELMLLANEQVAQYLSARKLPAIYRVHGAPDPEKLERFGRMCHELGLEFDPEAAEEPRELSKFLRKLEAHPKKATLHGLLLRAMQQARYDVTNEGHFGLASDAYLHFTSPIRRYSDLVVHRLVRQSLRGEVPPPSEKRTEELATAALTASERERLTMEAERAISELYRALYMRSRLGETFDGTVTSLTGSGLYVQLTEPFVTVLVLYDDLGLGGYALDESGLRVVAKRTGDVVALGDELSVTVYDASVTRRQVYAKRAGEPARPVERGPRRGKPARTVKTQGAGAFGRGKKGKPRLGSSHGGRGGRKKSSKRR